MQDGRSTATGAAGPHLEGRLDRHGSAMHQFLPSGNRQNKQGSRQVSILGVIGHEICYRRPLTLLLDHLVREDQPVSWFPGQALTSVCLRSLLKGLDRHLIAGSTPKKKSLGVIMTLESWSHDGMT